MGYRGTRALPCGHRGGEAGLALPAYLSERVFAGVSVATLEPTAGVAGYERSTPTARPCPAGHRPRAPRPRAPRARPRARAARMPLPHMFTQKCRT